MGKPKRIGIFADLHDGHRAGLTHPNWFVGGGTEANKKTLVLEQEMWRKFTRKVKPFKDNLDLAIWNADMIDGRGERSGGTELITADREEQALMAARVIEYVGAKKNLITYGTPYHASGGGEDWENLVAREVGAEIHSHLFVDVNGLVFDVKHKVGGSTIPHGRFTALARERLWNLVWAEREDSQPKANVVIRSHVHYFGYCGTHGYLAMTTPALQAAATKYGARQCSGTVDFGFLTFDVKNKEDWSWHAHLVPLAEVKQAAVKA